MRRTMRLMGVLAATVGSFWFSRAALAQDEAPQYPQYVQYPQGGPPVAPAAGPEVPLTPDQIDQLVGPIALYPDPLLSLIFPASTYPQDVYAAEQWLASTPNPTESAISAQNWDDSIKGLVHYPTVLKMMADQIDWTQALGAAFMNQQPDVLASVQRLRAQAQSLQNLQSNQEEQVVDDSGSILIEPVDPDLMYVPQYDPDLAFSGPCPFVWGSGFAIGIWCDNDFDWHDHRLETGSGWWHGWNHPAAWDQHPPAWYHNGGWAAKPGAWRHEPSRPGPGHVTAAVVSHLGLDRPRGAAAGRPAVGGAARPAPSPIGRDEQRPAGNVFDSPEGRQDVQRDEARARPAPVAPARAPEEVRPEASPRIEAPRVEEAPRFEAPPPEQRPSAFEGGSGGEARAESDRGAASGGGGRRR